MISRYRVSLGGVQMDSLDANLVILDVGYDSVAPQISQERVAELDGYDYNGEYFEKTIVTITFELHIYGTKERNKACQKVNEWANSGGSLVISDRSGQYLSKVRCEKRANIESVRNWTDPLTIVFATTYVPHWLSNSEKTLSLSGASGSGTLKMDGNIGDAFVSVEATANAKITSAKFVAGSTQLELKGFELESGKKLIIDYVNGRYLRIRADGKSIMNKLQPTSSDFLAVPCGANTKCSFSGGKMTVAFKARGKWV